jgi:hypothetical protein
MPLRQIPEPCLTVDLEDSAERTGEHEWYAAALIELSRQLGVGNDYYFPLRGAAEILKPKRVAYPFVPMGA